MKKEKTQPDLFFISNAFKIIEAFKKPDEIITNKEKLIERTDISWVYSGKLISKLTETGYLKKTKMGRNKIISLTKEGKKLWIVMKEMRKII